eukprot:jgi/Picsp_1/1849/NSC_05316-R1_hypothetical protein CHLNCDRAFT_132885 [Chlorella variabilis]
MLRKVSRALGGKKESVRVRIDVTITELANLPAQAKSCRIVWARDAKLQITRLSTVQEGKATWSEELSIISSLDPSSNGKFAKKEFEFRVQMPNRHNRYATLGKCKVDLAKYVDSQQHKVTVPVRLSQSGVCELSFEITGSPVKGLKNEDGESVISSVSSHLSETGGFDDGMDLHGFKGTGEGEDHSSKESEPETSTQSGSDEKHQDDTVAAPGKDEEVQAVASKNVGHEATLTCDDKEKRERIGNEPALPPSTVLRMIPEESDKSALNGEDLNDEVRVQYAEEEAANAKAMLEESIVLLENETRIREQAEETIEGLEREMEWLEKKALKERADWERRMKDSLSKMESTIVLLEKVQQEKQDLSLENDSMSKEIEKLRLLVQSSGIEEEIQRVTENTKKIAEEEVTIEIDYLRNQLKGMASRLEAAEAQGMTTDTLASTSTPDEASDYHVKDLEDKYNAIVMELQYLKIENESLKQDAVSAASAAERNLRNAQREAEVYSQRAKEYASLLEESHAKCCEAEHAAAHAKSKIVLLEDKLERGDLQTAEVRQQLALMAISGAVASNTIDESETLRIVRQVQQASEATAQELASATNEIYSLQQEISTAKENLYNLQQELEDANRVAMSKQEENRDLKQELKAREEQLTEFVNLRQLLMDTVDRKSSSIAQDENHGVSVSQQGDQETEANELAKESSLMAAQLTEQLAASNTEKIELEKRIEELASRIKLLKSGSSGDLLNRIENLDRDLVVARNKAEVNEIFRGEHDRLAKDLVSTKLALAEAQEQIIITKRGLLKSQEKSMTFASKLTKLETKLYRKLSNVGRKHSSSSSG